jgi:hypothetical protein
MEKLVADIERELSRFRSLPPAQLQALLSVWPEAVGETVAANAWPTRLGRDGTLHVATSSSIWAFELGQLAPQILARLAEKAGEAAPSGLRFRVGAIPEPSLETSPELPRTPLRPTPADERLAADLVAGIGDADLRAKVAEAAAWSLARRLSDRCF